MSGIPVVPRLNMASLRQPAPTPAAEEFSPLDLLEQDGDSSNPTLKEVRDFYKQASEKRSAAAKYKLTSAEQKAVEETALVLLQDKLQEMAVWLQAYDKLVPGESKAEVLGGLGRARKDLLAVARECRSKVMQSQTLMKKVEEFAQMEEGEVITPRHFNIDWKAGPKPPGFVGARDQGKVVRPVAVDSTALLSKDTNIMRPLATTTLNASSGTKPHSLATTNPTSAAAGAYHKPAPAIPPARAAQTVVTSLTAAFNKATLAEPSPRPTAAMAAAHSGAAAAPATPLLKAEKDDDDVVDDGVEQEEEEQRGVTAVAVAGVCVEDCRAVLDNNSLRPLGSRQADMANNALLETTSTSSGLGDSSMCNVESVVMGAGGATHTSAFRATTPHGYMYAEHTAAETSDDEDEVSSMERALPPAPLPRDSQAMALFPTSSMATSLAAPLSRHAGTSIATSSSGSGKLLDVSLQAQVLAQQQQQQVMRSVNAGSAGDSSAGKGKGSSQRGGGGDDGGSAARVQQEMLRTQDSLPLFPSLAGTSATIIYTNPVAAESEGAPPQQLSQQQVLAQLPQQQQQQQPYQHDPYYYSAASHSHSHMHHRAVHSQYGSHGSGAYRSSDLYSVYSEESERSDCSRRSSRQRRRGPAAFVGGLVKTVAGVVGGAVVGGAMVLAAAAMNTGLSEMQAGPPVPTPGKRGKRPNSAVMPNRALQQLRSPDLLALGRG